MQGTTGGKAMRLAKRLGWLQQGATAQRGATEAGAAASDARLQALQRLRHMASTAGQTGGATTVDIAARMAAAQKLWPHKHRAVAPDGVVAWRWMLQADPHYGTLAGLPAPAALAQMLGVAPAQLPEATTLMVLDTETTGLGRGAGTLPFVLGVATLGRAELGLWQALLLDPAAEGRMLQALAAQMRGPTLLLSYNGKSFDWPLLRARALRWRQALPAPVAHLDLLPWVRRALGHALPSCRLTAVEPALWPGCRPPTDVPSAAVPTLYRDFLRSGAVDPLQPVLVHNRSDVLAVVALLQRLAAQCLAPTPQWAAGEVRVARWTVQGQQPSAQRQVQRAMRVREAACATEAALLAASLARRTGDVVCEGQCLAQAAAAAQRSDDQALRAQVCVAQAKYHEHRTRDLQQALIWAEQAAQHGAAEAVRRCTRLRARLKRRGVR
ncbi:MAG: ribonuclease H-like domain-containing protein [Polyangiales bacterium]